MRSRGTCSGALPWRQRLQASYGVARSLAIYYGRPWQLWAMRRFYARFVHAGDLCFDLGAHVGNRILCWRSLGARVVAVEPQPALATVLRTLYGHDRKVSIVSAAVGRCEGGLTLQLNLTNPTIASASPEFLAAAAEAPSFREETWSASVSVATVTLDGLIAQHGHPAFVKIDVEGFEAEAVAGLTTPVPALSLEFVPMMRVVIETALDRLRDLGDYQFNAYFGDDLRFVHDRPLGHAEVVHWLRQLGSDGPAGDVVASLEPRWLYP